MLEWYFRGFADELSPQLRYITPLPKKPSYYMTQYGVNYNPEWLIRVNVDHILGDEENPSRLPAALRDARNLPLLLETAVELARRKAVVEPSILPYHRKVCAIRSGHLSEILDMSPVYIRQIESGKKIPSLPAFADICNIINVSPDYLSSDSLKINARDDYNKLRQKFCLLTPKQAELLIAMMEVMINKME